MIIHAALSSTQREHNQCTGFAREGARSLGRSLARGLAREGPRSRGASLARALTRSRPRSRGAGPSLRSVLEPLARSASRSLGPSLAQPLARSDPRSLGLSLARSLARFAPSLRSPRLVLSICHPQTRVIRLKHLSSAISCHPHHIHDHPCFLVIRRHESSA